MATIFQDSFAGSAGASLTGRHPTSLTDDSPISGQSYAAPTSGTTAFVVDGSHGLYQADTNSGTVKQVVPVAIPSTGYIAFTLAYIASQVGYLGIELTTAAGTVYTFLGGVNGGIFVFRGSSQSGGGNLNLTAGASNALTLAYSSPATGTGTSTFTLTLAGQTSPVITYSDSAGDPIISMNYRSDATGSAATGRLHTVSVSDSATNPPTNTPGPFVYPQNLSDVTWTAAGTAKVASQPPTGGTTPYTYQWHLSTTINFTPSSSTAVAGQTTATGTFAGLVTGTIFEIRCVVSDSASNTATSDPRVLISSGRAPLVIGWVGDSIQAPGPYDLNRAASDDFADLLGAALGTTVTPVNQAIPGTATYQWLSGSANLVAAKAAFAAAGVTDVIWATGMNDAQFGGAVADFGVNLASGVNDLVASGYRVHLAYPTHREEGIFLESPGTTFDSSTTPLLIGYQAKVAALWNGTTIFRGDTESYAAFASRPTEFLNRSTADPGGIHPSVNGRVLLASNQSRRFLMARFPDVLGTTSSGGSTDPGIVNVRVGTAYTIAGASLTGTYDPITGKYTDAGVANVVAPTSYKFAGQTQTGTYTPPAEAGGASPADIATAVWAATSRALTDKAGFSLAPTGLDTIAITPVAKGATPNFRQMVVGSWRRWFGRTVYDTATGLLTGYADDGTTVLTQQPLTAAGTITTQGPPQ